MSLCPLSVQQSDQDEDLKTQVNMRLIQSQAGNQTGNPLYHRPQETLGSPEDIVQTSISALRRSFLEGQQGGGGMTEWDKRLASSPLRRADDAPMIEPLEPEEVSGLTWGQPGVNWGSTRGLGASRPSAELLGL